METIIFIVIVLFVLIAGGAWLVLSNSPEGEEVPGVGFVRKDGKP